MKIRISAGVSLPVLAIVISCSDKKEPPSFAFNPSLDSAYHINVTSGYHERYKNSLEDTTYTTTRFSLRCVQQDDSMYIMKLIFEGLQLIEPARTYVETEDAGYAVMAVPGVYDTLSTDNPPGKYITAKSPGGRKRGWHIVHREVVGDSLQVVFNRYGEVLRVSGYDSIIQHVLAKSVDREDLLWLKETIGTKTITDLLNQLFGYLPGRKIKEGENWVKNITLIAKAPVKYSNLITAERMQQETVQLQVKTEVSAKTGEGSRVYLEGKLKGTVKADAATGMMIACRMEENSVRKTDTDEAVITSWLEATCR